VSLTITAKPLEMNCVLKTKQVPRTNRIARFVRSLVHLELLPGILQHFRHEGECVKLAPLVQRSKYLLNWADFNDITHPQF
jgi:hypothetical protein